MYNIYAVTHEIAINKVPNQMTIVAWRFPAAIGRHLTTLKQLLTDES